MIESGLRNSQRSGRRRNSGLSRIETLLLIVSVALVFGIAISSYRTAQVRARRITCVSNLKIVGLSFRMWANEHGELLPWQLSTNADGTIEFTNSPDTILHFILTSNELLNPVHLACPSDYERRRAKTFRESISNSNLSYFAGFDSVERLPQTLRIGDRNIVGGVTNQFGITVSPSAPTEWSPSIHNRSGNVGLGDGSVMQFTSEGLGRQVNFALASLTNATELRLAIPCLPGELSKP